MDHTGNAEQSILETKQCKQPEGRIITYILQYYRGLCTTTYTIESYHSSKPMLLPFCKFILWMRFETRIGNLCNCLMLFQKKCNSIGIPVKKLSEFWQLKGKVSNIYISPRQQRVLIGFHVILLLTNRDADTHMQSHTQ